MASLRYAQRASDQHKLASRFVVLRTPTVDKQRR